MVIIRILTDCWPCCATQTYRYKGVLASANIGAFSKSYDLSKTMVEENEALFWNQTSYGAELMALLKTKAIPSILVVTSNPIPESPQVPPDYPFGPKPPRPGIPW